MPAARQKPTAPADPAPADPMPADPAVAALSFEVFF